MRLTERERSKIRLKQKGEKGRRAESVGGAERESQESPANH